MRKNFPVVTAVFLALAFLVASAPAQETAAKPVARNVVLIGWDGCQRDHLKEMIGRGEVPNLVALSKEGALVDVDVITGATDTKAGWTQILTGYAPARTGVYSNRKYQPIPVGYTVFERVEKFFGPDNVETVAIIGKKGHVDADAPRRVPYEQWARRQARQANVDRARPGLGNLQGGRIVEENGQKFVETLGKPYYNTKSHMDKFVNGLVENDKVGEMALRELERCKDKRFFFFIHFADPDHSGHKFGENSQEYTDAIKSDDAWTGRIIAKLREAGVYDRTLVYITADHGFNEGATGHSYAPYVFLATNDKQVTRNGVREDIAPTVLKHLGLDVSKVDPAFDGIPLDQPAPERKAPSAKPAAAPKPKRAAAGQVGRGEKIPANQSRSEFKTDAKRVAGRQPIRVFIVAGQSNATGYNHIRQYHGGREPFPETLRVQPRILFWPGSDTPQEKDNLWTALRVGDSGSFGPEIAFGHDMEQAMPGAAIAIVKYAVGGTGIARSVDYTDYIPAVAGFNDKGRNWRPPTDGREPGALYRALIANFRNAVSALERDGRKWELTGFVWMQGEHEGGISRKMAEDYEKLLSDFIKSVRTDLQAPSLPFAIGQVNSHTWAYGDIARKCQAEVCRKDRNALLVETVDLPRVSGDAAHFTADGMLTLGSRFAQAMLTRIPAGPR